MRKLTPKQEAFAREYAVGLNVKNAVLKAGYATKNPDQVGYENLQIPLVHQVIQDERRKIAKRMDISAMRVVQEYVSVGLSNIKALIDQDPATKTITIKDLSEVPDHVLASVASIEQIAEGEGHRKKQRTKLTLWPKTPALESLCKVLGFDRQKLDEEMARLEAGGGKAVKKFDPRTLDDEGWEAYKIVRAKMIEQAKL